MTEGREGRDGAEERGKHRGRGTRRERKMEYKDQWPRVCD